MNTLSINGKPAADNGLCMEQIPVTSGTCGPLPVSAQYVYLCCQPLPCPHHSNAGGAS